MSYGVGMTTTPVTRTEQVYEMLRSELLNGVLQPSHKLRMVELTERFGASQSVIREALTRLTEHIDRAPSLLIAYAREHGMDDLNPKAPPVQQDQLSNSDG